MNNPIFSTSGHGVLAVVSHDAGGAEIVSSYLKRYLRDSLFVVDGPARKIFAQKLGVTRSMALREAIELADTILCGTSWQSDLEFNAIKFARIMGKRSCAFLDHWVNFHERFHRCGETCLPDEIWVGDPIAEAMAHQTFPGLPITLVENPYFQDIRDQLATLDPPQMPACEALTVLYVCEPTADHALACYGNRRHWGYTEEDALRYFLENISTLGKPIKQILVRPHPSELPGKYAWINQKFLLPIVTAGTASLLAEIASCNVVVGCESMAMVIGLLADKQVISCIPPGGRPCVLPHPQIKRFQDIVNSSNEVIVP